MSEQMTLDWLETGMFVGDPQAKDKATKVIEELGSHDKTKAHDRHISMKQAKDLGLSIVPLEGDQKLQDAVLSVHHACVQTLTETQATKIIENQNGVAYIDVMRAVVVAR